MERDTITRELGHAEYIFDPMEMKKTLRGFSFFEVILYVGLFALMATALFQFSWNVFDIGTKERTGRRLFSDARFVTERINFFIRNASGIDATTSVWNDPNGKLVLNQLGSSDTVTIEVGNGEIILTESGQGPVTLHGSDTQVVGLTFLSYGSRDDGSEYVGFTLSLESVKNNSADSPYQATTIIQSGAFIRNSGL